MEGLTTARFMRKPFEIEAVRVTSANMELVANWCKGEIRTRERARARYIFLEVEGARTERQKMAYVGDWVMYGGRDFKFYNDTAFHNSFDEKQEVHNNVPGDVVRLAIDLDVTQPELVLAKGGTRLSLDTQRLFDEYAGKRPIVYETRDGETQRVA